MSDTPRVTALRWKNEHANNSVSYYTMWQLAEELERESDSLRSQVAELTRERDEARAAFSKSGESNRVEGMNIFAWRERAQAAESRAEALRSACLQASFCLRELLPDHPDSKFTVRIISAAIDAAIHSASGQSVS